MYYALHDTRTPLNYAIARVSLTAVLGYLSALQLPALLGIDPRWGVAGLAGSSGLSGWLEFALLKHSLKGRIGKTGLPASFAVKLWIAAGAGAAAGWAVKPAVAGSHPMLQAVVVLGIYGIVYFAIAHILHVPEVQGLVRRVAKIATILR
jgi:putative peptidoglycan lipid II flippase